jgi:hypothetical protein
LKGFPEDAPVDWRFREERLRCLVVSSSCGRFNEACCTEDPDAIEPWNKGFDDSVGLVKGLYVEDLASKSLDACPDCEESDWLGDELLACAEEARVPV